MNTCIYFYVDLVPGASHGLSWMSVPAADPMAGAERVLDQRQHSCSHEEGRTPEPGQHLLHEQRDASSTGHQAVSTIQLW